MSLDARSSSPTSTPAFALHVAPPTAQPAAQVQDPTSGGSIADALRAQTRMTWPRESELVCRHLPLGPGARVADICCGVGDFTTRLHDRVPGLELTGVDWSAAGIDFARRQRGDRPIEYLVADATCLPFADGHFDAVICRHALQVMAPTVRTAAVAELVRVCRPGGVIYINNEQFSMSGGNPGGATIARGYELAVRLLAARDIDLDCGPAQVRWLAEAGLDEVWTLPWLVTSEADPLGFLALIDGWDGVFASLALAFGFDAGAREQIRSALVAHRRAVALGSASWPIWSSFARKG